jgi:hypothetical protein
MLGHAGTVLNHAGVLKIQLLTSSKRVIVVSFTCSAMLGHAGAMFGHAQAC